MRTVLVVLFLAAALLPKTGAAAAVTLSPSGGGTYLLAGQALQNVSGLDITITYDAASLGNPRVMSDGLLNGALLMANTTTPGTIRLAAVTSSSVQGSGLLATISFDRSASREGGQEISGLKVTAISPQGVKSPMPTIIAGASGIGSDSGSAAATGQTAQQSSTAAGGSSALPVIVPAPLMAASVAAQPVRPDDQPVPAMPVQESPTGPAVLEQPKDRAVQRSNKGQGDAVERRPVMNDEMSVRERFRKFRGPWTVRETGRLFQDPMPGYRQEPLVALSDGRTLVRVTVVVGADAKGMPYFTMTGGSILSAVQDRESTNTWVLQTWPDKDVLDAVVRVDDGRTVREIPLTVAPPSKVDLDGSGTVTEKDFVLYGQQRAMKGPKERNYVADYVFAVNYFVAAGQGSEEKADMKKGKKHVASSVRERRPEKAKAIQKDLMSSGASASGAAD